MNRTCEAPLTSARALRERWQDVTKRSMVLVLGRLPFYGEPKVSTATVVPYYQQAEQKPK